MVGLFVGMALGVFIGAGLTCGCLAFGEWRDSIPQDRWIDEALERAIKSVRS